MTSVYGAMHSELAQAMRLLAKLSYILGDLPEVRYFVLIKNTTCTYTYIGLNQNCQPDILEDYFFLLSILITLKKNNVDLHYLKYFFWFLYKQPNFRR